MSFIIKMYQHQCKKWAGLFVAQMLLLILSSSCTSSLPTASDASMSPDLAQPDNWGVEVVAVRSSVAGRMLDFRFKVHDEQKAAVLFDRRNNPYLIHQKSNSSLAVASTAKTGPLKPSNLPKVGRTYWMFFNNMAATVQPGDQVTFVIGDFRKENIIVE